jgi:hypothetical protein
MPMFQGLLGGKRFKAKVIMEGQRLSATCTVETGDAKTLELKDKLLKDLIATEGECDNDETMEVEFDPGTIGFTLDSNGIITEGEYVKFDADGDQRNILGVGDYLLSQEGEPWSVEHFARLQKENRTAHGNKFIATFAKKDKDCQVCGGIDVCAKSVKRRLKRAKAALCTIKAKAFDKLVRLLYRINNDKQWTELKREPTKRSGLQPFLRVMCVAFLLNPIVLVTSWFTSTCNEGASFGTYVIPICAALVAAAQTVVCTRMANLHDMHKQWHDSGPRSEDILGAEGVLNMAHQMAYETVMGREFHITKDPRVLQVMGVLELLDWFTDAAQPGQVYHCTQHDGRANNAYADSFENPVLRLLVSKITFTGVYVMAWFLAYVSQALYIGYYMRRLGLLPQARIFGTAEKNFQDLCTSEKAFIDIHIDDLLKKDVDVESAREDMHPASAPNREQNNYLASEDGPSTVQESTGLLETVRGFGAQAGEFAKDGVARAKDGVAKTKNQYRQLLLTTVEEKGEQTVEQKVQTLADAYGTAAEISEVLGLTTLAEDLRETNQKVGQIHQRMARTEENKPRVMSGLFVHIVAYVCRVVIEADVALWLAVTYTALFYDDMGYIGMAKTVFTISLSTLTICAKSMDLWSRLWRSDSTLLAQVVGAPLCLASMCLVIGATIKLIAAFQCPSHFFNLFDSWHFKPHCHVDTMMASGNYTFESS